MILTLWIDKSVFPVTFQALIGFTDSTAEQISRLCSLSEKEKNNALNEVRILASVKHPNVIAYKEAFIDEDSKSLCLILEYANGGDLFQKITKF